MTAPPPMSQRVLAERLRLIIAESPQGVAAPALLGSIAAVLLWSRTPRAPLVAALTLLFAALAWWVSFYLELRRSQLLPEDAARWARGVRVRTLAHGLAWGVYSLVLFPSEGAFQSLLVAFMYGLVAGAVVVDGPHFPTFLAFALPTLLPVILRCFAEGTAASIASGAAGLVGLVQSSYAALSSSRITSAALRARFENLELLDELGKQKELAEGARLLAEAANRGKSRFLAAASHDLRQPMHALRLFASAAKGSASDAERRQILERIDASVSSLSALFDALLDISRLDAGALEPRVSTLDLSPFLTDLLAEHQAAAQERGLSLRLRCVPARVRTDPVLLGRVLRNLLTNALTYTERGGVLLACRKRGERVRIEVWDTGVGIAQPQQAQVFEEFFQLHNSERDRRKGVGLGLSIVARISALLGYRLELASRPGKGSRFSVEMACHDAPRSERDAAPTLDDTPLIGVTVLVLDDEQEILAATVLRLKQYGCHALAAASLAEAERLLQLHGGAPDLIVSDYRLRDGDTGLEAARTLRAQHGRELPVLIVSADSSAQVSEPGMLLLQKPVEPEQLKRALLQLL